jgi:Ca2+/Na+ antiporter
MKILKFLICLSFIGFFITTAISGYHLSHDANLLLNGNLTGNSLTKVDHGFLMAHISIIKSVYFAISSSILLIIYFFANCFKS